MNKPVTVALLADAKEALRALADAVEELGAPPNKQVRIKALEGWRAQSGRRTRQTRQAAGQPRCAGPSRARPIDRPVGHARGHGLGFRRRQHGGVVELLPRRERPADHVVDVQFGMLGAGWEQSLGAAVAAPDQRVCVLTGDGAFGMHSSEVESAVRLNLPIVFVVLVDGRWGWSR